MILLLSCSLNPASRSRVLAHAAHERFLALGETVEFIDLQNWPLPLCDGATAYSDANAQRLSELARRADAIVIASPVYNYGVSAAAKNLVELTGRSWTGKVVGMLFAAGGWGSYMSGMPLANSLMLDFRCLVIPRYVYSSGPAIENGVIVDAGLALRIDELAREVLRVSRALGSATPLPATSELPDPAELLDSAEMPDSADPPSSTA